jgi:diguanylate cyclase (GGDEF)-like protein
VQFSHPERIQHLVARGSGTAWYAVYYTESVAHVANVRCHSVEHEGRTYAYLVIEDVTEQHYLKAAFDAVEDVILIIGSDERILYASRSAESLFGSLYFGMDVAPILQRPSLEPRWWHMPTQRFEERRILINDQPYEAMTVTFRFAGESETSTILMLRNVLEEEELKRLATHDALTGIYNVRHFSSALSMQIAQFENGDEGALALIDLDHFKPINDEMGHAAGDAALIMFASVVRSEINASDVFARLGGDEFAILFPDRDIESAKTTLDRIYERLGRTPLRFDGIQRPLSASCGLVRLRASDAPNDRRMRADRALYEAKRQGRGRYVVAAE